MTNKIKSIKTFNIKKIEGDNITNIQDNIVIEEPLEIILAYFENGIRIKKSLSITMRTPSENDFELVIGFLFAEGIIKNYSDIVIIKYIASELKKDSQYNVIQVDLNPNLKFNINQLNRNFYTSSSCGVCGKSSIDLVYNNSNYFSDLNNFKVNKNTIISLVDKLQNTQKLFASTGGIHASALFDNEGNIIALREDVGRHNALDKLIGFSIKKKLIPLSNCILLLSGRISFELVQKANIAGISIIVAIGAPSSLAIELAEENNITLIGFLRQQKFNIYTNNLRII